MNEKKDFLQDCPNYPYIPTILGKRRRIIAIGDLHGDYDLAIRTLKLASVITVAGNGQVNWKGGDTIIVQTGDKVDGCRPMGNNSEGNGKNKEEDHECGETADDDIKILNLFYELNLKAMKDNGAVYSLLGNHELMNVQGDLKYVSKKSLLEFATYKDNKIHYKDSFSKLSPIDRGIVARKYAFKPGNQYASFLGCANIGIIIIGSFLFAHAGLVPEFINIYGIKSRNDIIKFNSDIRKWLLGNEDENIKKKINHKESPFWSRLLGAVPNDIPITDERCLPVSKIMKTFKIGHLVIGHTPQFQGISSTCDNAILKIDIGASKAFKKLENYIDNDNKRPNISSAQALEILDDGKVINILKE